MEIKNGLRRAGVWLLGLAWMIAAGIGVTSMFSGDRKSQITGWGFLLIAAIVFILTMNRWIKIVPVLLAYGLLGALLATASGHALNRPELPMSFAEGIVLMLFFGASAAISATFTKRRLRLSDRIALFAFVALLFREMAQDRISPIGLAAALGCLVFAWCYDHFSNGHHANRSLFGKVGGAAFSDISGFCFPSR